MESRYYYSAGQTPENTKISDRSHALHITKDGWKRLTKHLDRNKIIKEEKEREKEHRRFLKDGSRDMIKNWANSLENIRKRKDGEKVKAIEEEKRIRHEKFMALKREQEEKRRIFVEKAKKSIFMSSGTAKMLTSAYQAGEIINERQKQIEFKAKLQKHEDEEEAKEIEIVRRNAKEHAEEVKARKINYKRKRKEWGEYMRKFLAEKAQIEEEEANKRLQKEEQEWQDALDELKCMERMDKEHELKKKRDMRADIDNQLKKQCEAKHLEQTEDNELDECVQVFHNAKQRINCMVKAREIELRNGAISRRLAATRSTFEKKAEQAAELAIKEEESRQIALAEKEAAYLKREKQLKDLRDKDAREKIEDMQDFLKKDEQRKKANDNMLKWERLNSYKTYEVIKKREQDRKMKKRQEAKEYGEELLQQMKERKEFEKYEINRDDYITKTIAVNDDENFFALADEVMAHAVEKGRATRPVNMAILDYKKINLLGYERDQKDDPNRCEDYMKGMYGYTKNFVTKANRITMPYRRCKCQQEQ